jgi:DNA-binding GntR family transcriptional regulator
LASRETTRSDGLPTSEVVYLALRERIVTGELEPDTRLREIAIAAEFGVSRTPVHEALRRLSADNLVIADPTRGVVVHAPDPAQVSDSFVIREVLDGLATRLAAHRITPLEVGRLKAIVDSMEESTLQARYEQLVGLNVRFHDVVYRAAGNATLERVASDLRVFVRRFARPFVDPERAEEVLAEHREILEALETRDPDRAEVAARHHLATARDALERMYLREYAEKDLA